MLSKGKTAKGTAIKRIEMRRCAACRQVRHKSELLRFVKTDAGVSIDEPKKIFGRGVYVCKSSECAELLKKRRSLDKIFKLKIPGELYDKVKETVLM